MKSRFARRLAFVFGLFAMVGLATTRADEPKPVRLNKFIELMESGKPAFGVFSSNLSTRTGASIASSNLDFVIIDLEHSPYDVTRLEGYLLAMVQKSQILQKGNLQPNVMPLVRVPAAGREQLQFVIKQVLDLGAYGIVVPHVESAEDARAMVQACRFPQLRGAADFEPQGQRGVGYGWAARYWGLSGGEYAERADLWPLDPEGELLLWVMVESAKGVENCREIIATPGVSGVFIGPSDLAFSLGVPLRDPEVEVAIEKVVKACNEAGVPCGTLTSGSGVPQRLEQGFRFLAVGGDSGPSGGVSDAVKAGRSFKPIK